MRSRPSVVGRFRSSPVASPPDNPTAMSFAKLLVEKHSRVAAYVLPASVAVGFAYTANYGTNPLEDLKNVALGAGPGDSRVINVRLGALGGNRG